jgi:hypothetical protein
MLFTKTKVDRQFLQYKSHAKLHLNPLRHCEMKQARMNTPPPPWIHPLPALNAETMKVWQASGYKILLNCKDRLRNWQSSPGKDKYFGQ